MHCVARVVFLIGYPLPLIGHKHEQSIHLLIFVQEYWFGEQEPDLVPVGKGLERSRRQPH